MLGPGRHQEEGRTLGPCQAVWEGSLFSPQRGDAEPRSRELARGLMGWGCWFTCPQPVSGGLCTCSQWGWRESREAHAACTGYGSEQPQGTGGLSFDHCQLLSTNVNLFCPEVALQCLWRASESILALLLSPFCPQVLWGRQCWRWVRFLGVLRSSKPPAVRTRGGPGWPLSCHPRPRGQEDGRGTTGGPTASASLPSCSPILDTLACL